LATNAPFFNEWVFKLADVVAGCRINLI